MRYDGKNPLHAEQARHRLEKFIADGKIFDLTEKNPVRTLSQNNYLFLTLGYWGTQTGYTKDEAEARYKQVNRDIYYTTRTIAGEETLYIRHTYELDTAEMTLSIERWRNWAAANDACPVYIPAPEDASLVAAMKMEVERHKHYL